MVELFKKELRLSASVLSYLFIAFGLIPFFPGYPILVATFFVCLGMFQSFLSARENGDIVFTSLLPIPKSSVVKGKYLFCLFIEGCAFLVTSAVTLVRMTVLSDIPAYRENALMNANPAFLGLFLVIFGLFNSVFICGFFKTAYRIAKPFVTFIILAFVTVGIGETLHHIPGLEWFNSFGFDNIAAQLAVFAAGAIVFVLLTFFSEKRAERLFDVIDL